MIVLLYKRKKVEKKVQKSKAEIRVLSWFGEKVGIWPKRVGILVGIR
jgi:hypothetical protein